MDWHSTEIPLRRPADVGRDQLRLCGTEWHGRHQRRDSSQRRVSYQRLVTCNGRLLGHAAPGFVKKLLR